MSAAERPGYTNGVRIERNGWRDERISRRHREWGASCPAVDLDFLLVEFHVRKPVALVEYKHHNAGLVNLKHHTYEALSELADGYRGGLPFIVAFYWPEIWAFRVLPVNSVAKQHYKQGEAMTERQFVQRLYRLRRLVLAADLVAKLNDIMPTDEAA